MVAKLFFGFSNSSTFGKVPRVPVLTKKTINSISKNGLNKIIQSHLIYGFDFFKENEIDKLQNYEKVAQCDKAFRYL